MKENNRILIVDDNESIHQDFKKVLTPVTEYNDINNIENLLFQKRTSNFVFPTYQIDDAYQGEEAIELVEKAYNSNQPYALIFMDVRMPPGIDGIETTYKIWEKSPYTEVVICTAYSDYSWVEMIEKLGTTDRLLFLKKPFNSVEVKQLALSLVKKWNLNQENQYIVNNLENEVKERTAHLQTLLKELERVNRELNEKNQILAELAKKDSLTGLLNHASFYERLDEIFNQAKRHNFSISVAIIDIDSFKKFNDTYGHQIGDEILEKVSNILKRDLRKYDVKVRCKKFDECFVAGRCGGDEFMLVLSYCGVEESLIVCKRLQQGIKEVRIDNFPEICITVSIGIAVLESGVMCDDSRKLVNLADKALYQVKNSQKDDICCLTYI